MICYIDSSIVLRSLLNQEPQFRAWTEIRSGISSVLLFVECQRVLDRCRLQGLLTDGEISELKRNLRAFIRGVTLYAIDEAILHRAAEPFSTVVGSLDALHLATAIVWTELQRSELVFLTFDTQLELAAVACGLRVRML